MKVRAFERQQVPASSLPPVVKAKWSPEILQEGFIPFPKRLLRCLPDVFKGEDPLAQLAVLLSVIDYRRPNLIREHPSLSYLLFVSGLPEARFRAALKQLRRRKLVDVDGDDDAVEVGTDGLEKAILRAAPHDDDEEGPQARHTKS